MPITFKILLMSSGVMLFHLIAFLKYIDQAQKESLSWKRYCAFWHKHWDNVLISLLHIPILLPFEAELMARYNDIARIPIDEPNGWLYFITGFIANQIVNKFVK